MKHTFENDVLTIYPEGNIDTTNAESVGQEIDALIGEHSENALVLDMEDLKYISSAGLRQILRLKKKEKDFKVVNCSSEIYDIFEMTGFTEMMDISKAFRKMSVEGCQVIGEGSNGIVYRLNPDTIIKVYKNNDALDDIKRERELAKTALVLGVNTAIPFDVVNVGDKYGSVFELLSAKSLTALILEDKENRDKYIRIFADMLKDIHKTEVKEGVLPSAKQAAIGWVEWLNGHIPAETYDKLHAMVEAVPESNMMIHGDYHTNNVHYDNNEAILIDMDTLSVGHPLFEFSSIYLAFKGFGETDHTRTEKFLKIDYITAGYIFDKLIDYYFEGKDEAYKNSVVDKARVISYTRALRRTIKREPDNKTDIEHFHKQLIGLIVKISDTADVFIEKIPKFLFCMQIFYLRTKEQCKTGFLKDFSVPCFVQDPLHFFRKRHGFRIA
ncbi:MAG: anti-sigma factor antagonist [Erysipelotrichaceae bacterium]|nr:anti-sigma factor antagonist [Erysipelotrichaceae bacterium]